LETRLIAPWAASGIFCSQALAARFPHSTGVSFFANHPGLVDTGDGAADSVCFEASTLFFPHDTQLRSVSFYSDFWVHDDPF
jgi:hypothetical protein